ncbi:MAG: thioredoxin domain-containing protein [Deltaproteobacteria bacterium]|nr:thioredoxin domain-containing protein [Deltaproteobacteria bacterium]
MSRRNTTGLYSALVGLLIISGNSGCRQPAVEDIDEYDAGNYEFDAGQDDSGPSIACPNAPDLFNNAQNPYQGGTEAVDLEVVNYSYFHCTHCARLAGTIKLLETERPDLWKRVRFYFHHFPFSNETAEKLHASTVAARKQGGDEAFWAMHDYIYNALREDPSVYMMPEALATFADEELGLDMALFAADMESEETLGYIQWDRKQASDLGVTGTPAVYICGERVPPSNATLYDIDGLISTLENALD